jgi:AraC-like DNA-binding protein
LLRESGVDLPEALTAARVPPDIFADPDNTISYPALERLLRTCAERCGRDDFGLLIGQRSRLAEMGLAGMLARCSATVGDALECFVGHFNLHDGAATMSLAITGSLANFVYVIAEGGLTDTRHFQLGAMAIAFNILQDLCGPGWQPTLVTLACRSPADPRACQRHFRSPVRFDSPESAIVFERRWLELELPPVGREARERIEVLAATQATELRAEILSAVRRIVRKQLLFGRCSMDEVAATLGMHRRTLDRRLERHDVSFRDLVEAVQRDVACQLLRETGLEVQQVAESLRFSTAANFATAFRRWTGMTPSCYRRTAT